jgi:hypothetical protein
MKLFFIPTTVNIGGIKINSAEHNGVVSFGANCLIGNKVFGKKNQGFGQQLADCTISIIPIVATLDDEIIDNPVLNITRL